MSPYPVRLVVPPSAAARNRLTVAFRPILAIPHIVLIGPVVWSSRGGSPGLLGTAAYFLAIVNWFSVVFTGSLVPGIRDFALFYLRWRARATSYQALLVDPYPPFSDSAYPTSIDVDAPVGARDRLSIAFRVILVIPHLIALFFVLIAWLAITIVAWFAILFTGRYPVSLYAFAAGALQWVLRVEAYLLLLVDEYPPFELSIDSVATDRTWRGADGGTNHTPPPLHA
jgi:hypothetical protein